MGRAQGGARHPAWDASDERWAAGGARAVVIGADPSPERVTALLDLGASGFLRHDAGPVDVVDAIEAVAAGAAALEASAAATVLEQWRRLREPVRSGAAPAGLTAREHEV